MPSTGSRPPGSRSKVQLALVVGGAGDAPSEIASSSAEQPADDHRPAGPRAGAADHEPVAAGLDRIAVTAVRG